MLKREAAAHDAAFTILRERKRSGQTPKPPGARSRPCAIMRAVSRAQRWIVGVGATAIMALWLFPSWHQICQGREPVYGAYMGHHAFWSAPPATGEQSWIENFPAWQCRAAIEWAPLLRECLIVVLISAILFMAVKSWPLTIKKTAFVSLLLALSLPFPAPPDFSIPLVAILAISPKLLYDCEFGSCGIPLVAALVLALYFVTGFLLLRGVTWIGRFAKPQEIPIRK